VFPLTWYSRDSHTETPKPLGLTLGILAVAVGHLFLLPIFYLYRRGLLTGGLEPKSIQSQGAKRYDFREGLKTHLSQPEGFILLTLYLSVSWMTNGMPHKYYSFQGTIQWDRVFYCLVVQDGLQYMMHRLEHSISPEFYKKSHKPHHRFTNPRIFDAFNGSMTDTIMMILVPLYSTANIVRDCNVWTYMAFGSMYANWLVLIHSEYFFPWDGIFQTLGLGTSADHHVHHAVFKYNYGHLFMWFDQIAGTYKNPQAFAPKLFNPIS
jgi:sterol desaturase/sphingolipid hydroxylase (fatty acid hydroxylase superfamily)